MPRKGISEVQRAVLVRMATTGDYVSERSGEALGLRQWRTERGGWYPHYKGHEAPAAPTLVRLRSLGFLSRHINDGRNYSYHITDKGRAEAQRKGASTRAGAPSSQDGPQHKET